MLTREHDELDWLLAAHANRELTEAEAVRLRELVETAGEECASSVAAIDDLHARFASERALRQQLVVAGETDEEAADEGYRRLLGAAARAEQGLRAELRHPVTVVDVRSRAGLGRVWIGVAVAAVVLLAAGLWWSSGPGMGRPGLLPGAPADRILGTVSKILLNTELHAADAVFRWHATVGASRYDVCIEDLEGRTLLRRPVDLERSLSWNLSDLEFAQLSEVAAKKSSPGAGLLLRIIASDGAGVVVGSSGDLPITLVH